MKLDAYGLVEIAEKELYAERKLIAINKIKILMRDILVSKRILSQKEKELEELCQSSLDSRCFDPSNIICKIGN